MKIKNYFGHLTGLELNVLKVCVFMIVLALIVFCTSTLSSCTSCRSASARARASQKTITQPKEQEMKIYELECKIGHLENMLRAYNHLVHRVWIDKPTYFEECLTEGDEFATLNDLMGKDWSDTFTFYNAEDSIAYHMNWDSDETVRIVRHIVQIPEPTKSRLRTVFGDDY